MIRWDVGCAMASPYDDDGFLGVQIDAEGEQESGVTAYEVLYPYGFYARPLDPVVDPEGNPDPRNACSVLHGTKGGVGYAMPLMDPRLCGDLPALNRGESMQFGAAGQFLKCNADGSITAFTTTDGTLTGGPQGLYFGPNGFRIEMPFGTLIFDQAGFRVSHKFAGKFGLRYIGGVPGIPSSMTSFAYVTAASWQENCSLVSSGTSKTGNVSSPVRWTEFSAFMTSLAGTLTQISAALASVTTGQVTPATQAACDEAATNAAALAGQIPALVVTMKGATATV